ncbi:MAG TPA: LppX_LprAFG lipoprotein [Mycobacterium sp.]|nr:LppX_LprAFG lipoprotein [Mycobacterium sp.]
MRRLLAVLAMTSAVVVGGCDSGSSPSSSSWSPSPPTSPAAPSPSKPAERPLPDPAALLKQSSATTKNLKSAHLVLSVAGKVAQMPVQTLEGDLTNDPKPAAKGDAMIDIMGAEVNVKFAVFHRRLYVAMPGGEWRDYGFASGTYDVTRTLNPAVGLANMLANFVDPKVDGRETVDDQQTIRVSGKVTVDAVNKFVPQLGATTRMSSTVWIQERGDHEVVEATLEPSREDFVQMKLSKWNEPVTIDKLDKL